MISEIDPGSIQHSHYVYMQVTDSAAMLSFALVRLTLSFCLYRCRRLPHDTPACLRHFHVIASTAFRVLPFSL